MSSRPKLTTQVEEPAAERPGRAGIPALANNRLYEIKSPLILQLGQAALTDGLDALRPGIDGERDQPQDDRDHFRRCDGITGGAGFGTGDSAGRDGGK